MPISRTTPRRLPVEESEFELPPFPGFDKVGMRFLKELKADNSREWLTPERKEIYTNHLLEPMKMLLSELRGRFRDEGLPFTPSPRRDIFRLYRDTRFSKDKRPFKTHIGAAIPFAEEGKEGIGNYLHIEPGSCFYGGGAYFIDGPGLKRLRAAVAADHDHLREIIRDIEKNVGPLEGAKLKRGPVGFDRDHPALDLLLYTQMWASKSFPDKLAASRELVDWIVITTRQTAEFNGFLYEAIRGTESPLQ